MRRFLWLVVVLAGCGDADGGEPSSEGGAACPEGARQAEGGCLPGEGEGEGEAEGEGEGEGEPECPEGGVRTEDGCQGSGSGGRGPWTESTCPPRRIITSRLCDDPVTGCVCADPPDTCEPGWKCLGGMCFPPGQKPEDECTPDRLGAADVILDIGAGEEPVNVVRGEVTLRTTEDGWTLLLPASAPGAAVPSLIVRGQVEPPVEDGEVVDVTLCRHHRGGTTLKLALGREVRLFAMGDGTYVQGDDCVPEGFKPQIQDINCPPSTGGEDPDTACRVCRPTGLVFGGGRPTVTGRLGRVALTDEDIPYRVISGLGTSSCQRTCCDGQGRREELQARLDYAVVIER